jgi:RNase adaptor protein for sRNA GlmZ degradation
LQKDGTARRIAESFDLCLVRSLPEEEIEDATRKLRSSTAAIEQQTRMLKAQQEALTKIQEDNRRTHLNSKQAAEIRQRKRLQEMVDTSQAVISSPTYAAF